MVSRHRRHWLLAAIVFLPLITAPNSPLPGNDGWLDPNFGIGGLAAVDAGGWNDHALAVHILPDGRILLAGHGNVGASQDYVVMRLNADGSVDDSFGDNGRVVTDFVDYSRDYAFAMTVDGQERILVAGKAEIGADYSNARQSIVRYLPDGQLDTTFGQHGKVDEPYILDGMEIQGPHQIQAILTQTDGKILTANRIADDGWYVDAGITRYLEDGTRDETFGEAGRARWETAAEDGMEQWQDIAIQDHDGMIVVAGMACSGDFQICDLALARYDGGGNLDPAFADGGVALFDLNANESATNIALQENAIVVGGFTGSNPIWDFLLLRYRTDGTLDSSFGNNGVVVTDINSYDRLSAIAIDPLGRIVAGGFTQASGAAGWDFVVARYTQDGTLDPTFGLDGMVVTDFGSPGDGIYGIALQPDWKIVAAGLTEAGPGARNFGVARYCVGRPPVADAAGPYIADEGDLVRFDATGSADPDGDSLLYAWDLNYDNQTFDTDLTGNRPVHPYADNFTAPRTIALRVTDPIGLADVATTTLMVNNLVPSVKVPIVEPEPSVAGESVVASALFVDRGMDDWPFACLVDFGDGSAAATGTVGDRICSGPAHLYVDSGVYPVTFTITDKDGGAGQSSTEHTVTDVTSGAIDTGRIEIIFLPLVSR